MCILTIAEQWWSKRIQSPLSFRTMLVTRFLLHGYMRPRWTTRIGPMPTVFSAKFFDEKTHVSNKHDLCLAGKMLDRGTFQKQIVFVGSVCLFIEEICTEHWTLNTELNWTLNTELNWTLNTELNWTLNWTKHWTLNFALNTELSTEHCRHRTDSCSPSRSHISVQKKSSYKHGPIRKRRL